MRDRGIALALLALLLAACASGGVGGHPQAVPAAPAPEGAAVSGTTPAPQASGVGAIAAASTPNAAAEASATDAGKPKPAPRVEFASQIRPLLEARCSPCHFEGGRMYDRLPFDQEATIRTLGQRLFTRIKSPEDQEILRTFLDQPPDRTAPRP